MPYSPITKFFHMIPYSVVTINGKPLPGTIRIPEKRERCPVAVLYSCESSEQLDVAWKFSELWLKKYGFGRNSPEAKLLFDIYSRLSLGALGLRPDPSVHYPMGSSRRVQQDLLLRQLRDQWHRVPISWPASASLPE